MYGNLPAWLVKAFCIPFCFLQFIDGYGYLYAFFLFHRYKSFCRQTSLLSTSFLTCIVMQIKHWYNTLTHTPGMFFFYNLTFIFNILFYFETYNGQSVRLCPLLFLYHASQHIIYLRIQHSAYTKYVGMRAVRDGVDFENKFNFLNRMSIYYKAI